MAILNIPLFMFPTVFHNDSGTLQSHLIDLAGEKREAIFSVSKTGTINKIAFRTGTVTTAQDLRIGLYTVDGSGAATTTLYGGSAAAVRTVADGIASTTTYEATLPTGASAVKGDIVAIVVEFDSTVGALNIVDWSNSIHRRVLPYSRGPTGKINGSIFAAIGYDDGTYEDVGGGFYYAISSTAFNSGTGGSDEYALRFQYPLPVRITGWWWRGFPAAAADYEMILYEGTIAKLTKAMDGDHTAATVPDTHEGFFDSTFLISASTVYRIAIRPTTANSVTLRRMTGYASNAQLDGMPGGKECFESTRLDQGSWADVNTNLPQIGVLIDQMEAGSVNVESHTAQIVVPRRYAAY